MKGGIEVSNHDFAKLSKISLFKLFEQERLEWLAAGMSEADIFKTHFGELSKNNKLIKRKDDRYSGDYFVWLAERRHTRPDYKYAPGTPVSIDAVDPDGAWISGGRGELDDAEFNIDLEAALLSELTELERLCFVKVVVEDRKQQSVADELQITQQMVSKHIKAAIKKLNKFFKNWL